jgi:hypothetical protein
MAIRRGGVPIDETIAELEQIERRLEEAVASSVLREEPDEAQIDEFVLRAYRSGWDR